MKKTSLTFLLIFAGIGAAALFIFAKGYFNSKDKPYNDLKDSTYSVYALPIPDSVILPEKLFLWKILMSESLLIKNCIKSLIGILKHFSILKEHTGIFRL
jgi:hypothetical protein